MSVLYDFTRRVIPNEPLSLYGSLGWEREPLEKVVLVIENDIDGEPVRIFSKVFEDDEEMMGTLQPGELIVCSLDDCLAIIARSDQPTAIQCRIAVRPS